MDRFFGAAEWKIKFPNDVVHHAEKQTSDHSLILLDNSPGQQKVKFRFIFDSRWTEKEGVEQVVKQAWEEPVQGSKMYKLHEELQIRFN